MIAVQSNSLHKARQWQEWLAWRIDDVARPRWGDFLRDMVVEAHRFRLVVARRLRSSPSWDRAGGTMEEDVMALEPQAAARLARWHAQYPSELKRAPQWAQHLATALEGLLAQDVRLAREVDEVIATRGVLAVNVNPHAAPDQFPEQ